MKTKTYFAIESPDKPALTRFTIARGYCRGFAGLHGLLVPAPIGVYFTTRRKALATIKRTENFRKLLRDSLHRDNANFADFVKEIRYEVREVKIFLA